MIVSDTSEFGYAFTRDLCEAISAFTREAVASNAEAFHYRRAELRFAVERHLYISCVNSEPLFRLYVSARTGARPSVSRLPNKEQARIAQLLVLKSYSDKVRVNLGWRRFARGQRLRIGYNRFHAWWRRKEACARLQPPFLENNPEVLFHIVHEKFARYLQPIAEALPLPYAYLLAVDDSLKRPLAQLGYPYLDLSPDEAGPSVEPVKPALRAFPQIAEAFDKVYTALAHAKPCCVVVAEGNSPLDVVISEACKLLWIPILCIQQGWSPYVHSGFRNMSFTKMLVWGREFAELLKPYNPNQEFVAVGNHVLQHVTAKMAGQSGKCNDGVSFFLQAPCALLSADRYLEFLTLIEWAARTFPDTPILVREHPGYSVPDQAKRSFLGHKNVRFVTPATHSLEEVLLASRVAVTVFSTTILESIAVGILPIVCNLSSLPRYFPDVDEAGAGIEVRTIGEAKEVIRRVLENPLYAAAFRSEMESFREKFFEAGEPIKRITNEIMAIARRPI